MFLTDKRRMASSHSTNVANSFGFCKENCSNLSRAGGHGYQITEIVQQYRGKLSLWVICHLYTKNLIQALNVANSRKISIELVQFRHNFSCCILMQTKSITLYEGNIVKVISSVIQNEDILRIRLTQRKLCLRFMSQYFTALFSPWQLINHINI